MQSKFLVKLCIIGVWISPIKSTTIPTTIEVSHKHWLQSFELAHSLFWLFFSYIYYVVNTRFDWLVSLYLNVSVHILRIIISKRIRLSCILLNIVITCQFSNFVHANDRLNQLWNCVNFNLNAAKSIEGLIIILAIRHDYSMYDFEISP